MAKKWQRVANFGRRISSPIANASSSSSSSSSPFDVSGASSVADKGHFVVYTAEGTRFMVPLACLESSVFQELLKVSEEEYGLPGDGPITLPCNAMFMEYLLCLLRRRMSKEVEMALLGSISANHASACSFLHVGNAQQATVCH